MEGGNPVRKEYLVFGSPCIGEEEIAEVVASLRSGWIGAGPKVVKFQEMMKNYVNSKHALAVNSCTAALHLGLIIADVKPGDEVITSAMTFAATANVIIHVGATPVFVDCDIRTMNIEPKEIKKKIKKKPRAIIPVHMAGRPCDMDAIQQIAKQYKLVVIEDAAHGLGA